MKLKHTAYLERMAKRRMEIYRHVKKTGSLTETAAAFKISKQRVEQIVKKTEVALARKYDAAAAAATATRTR
jgi:predicted DNA-binding protein YlxM (UPF0122 family)